MGRLCKTTLVSGLGARVLCSRQAHAYRHPSTAALTEVVPQSRELASTCARDIGLEHLV